jgi:DUF438 domain-containing protein
MWEVYDQFSPIGLGEVISSGYKGEKNILRNKQYYFVILRKKRIMSEYINNSQIRKEKLFALAFAIMTGESDRKMVDDNWDFIRQVTPYDVFFIVDKLMKTSQDIGQIKKTTAKIINLYYEPLQAFAQKNRPEHPFIVSLKAENREVEKIIEEMKNLLKELNVKLRKDIDSKHEREQMLRSVRQLKIYEKHYSKKENILFPQLEKHKKDYRCVSVMWSMQDDYRDSLRELEWMLSMQELHYRDFNNEIGRLFFAVKPLIFREEYILFPVAEEVIPVSIWDEMYQEAFGIGFAYIEIKKPEFKTNGQIVANKEKLESRNLIDLNTGSLSVEQIIMLFNHLPVDITYVDENDRVRFFSQPQDRFFTRSKSILGRTVQNCHPHESVHIVERIVKAFRSGEKSEASFRIQMKGKFILIRYFAVRNKNGEFKGTLEVSQDITGIRKLDGERRLLDWE